MPRSLSHLVSTLLATITLLGISSLPTQAQTVGRTSFEFNGTDTWISANVQEAVGASTSLTMEAWVYPEYSSGQDGLITFHDKNGGNRNMIVYRNQRFQYYDGTVSFTPSEHIFRTGQWYHVAVTIDDDAGTLYVNGRVEATFTTSVRPDSTGLFSLGQEWDGNSLSDFFAGRMDEVRIWSTGRSQSQIQAGMTASLTGSEADLEAYYRFEEDLEDATGNYRGLYWEGEEPKLGTPPTTRFAAGIDVKTAGEALTVYVDARAKGDDNGTSWNDAHTKLRDVVDDVGPENVIRIAEGTYTPGTSRGDSFTITGADNGLELYGGYPAGGGARNPAVHETILSGDVDGDGTLSGNSYHVLVFDGGNQIGMDVAANISSATVLDGVTVTGGNANGSTGPSAGGGGLFCDGGGPSNVCSPKITGVNFVGNDAGLGGAMWNYARDGGASNPLIIDVVFVNNSAGDGGVLYNDGGNGGMSNPGIKNTVFSGNSGFRGGAIFNQGQRSGVSSPIIANAVFVNNSASQDGGAIYNQSGNLGVSSPLIFNSTFTGNSADTGGGAIQNNGIMGGTSNPLITNSIFYANTTGTDYIYDGADDVFSSYHDGATGTVRHTLITSGCPMEGTCSDLISGDPQFIAPNDPDGTDDRFGTSDDGLRLADRSPAVDVGDNSAVPSGVTLDVAGADRIQNGTVNLGAYEGTADVARVLYVDASAGGANDGSSWGDAYTALQDALDAATGNDEIWIAGGTYYPDEGEGRTADARGTAFYLSGSQDGLTIYGGFAGGESSPSERDLSASETILSGDVDQDGMPSSNSYHVVYLDGNDASGPITGATVMSDVTITGGNADGSGSYEDAGGGLLCQGNGSGSACSPTLQNLVFSENHADFGGGALYDNGRNGGASSPTIVGTVFTGNTAGTNGGALYNYGRGGESSPRLVNVTFEGNTAGASAGAIFNYSYTDGVSYPALTNVILHGNRADSDGNGVGSGDQMFNQGDEAVPALRYTLVEGGTSGIFQHNGSHTVYEDANGTSVTFASSTNVSADPSFVDGRTPAGADGVFGTSDDGLQVTSGSPVLDAGAPDTTGLTLPSLDVAGGERVVDNDNDASTAARVDVGAYEAPSRTKLPVELTGLGASVDGGGVILTWRTASEQDNAGFEIQRQAPGGEWDRVGYRTSRAADGTTDQPQSYRFEDARLPYESDSLAYRLRQVDLDGTAHVSEAVTVGRSGVTEFELRGTYPNPVRSRATVRFAIPEGIGAEAIQMRLYDVLGRPVRTLTARAESGRHQMPLDVTGLASGVYFLRLRAGTQVRSQKLTVVQ